MTETTSQACRLFALDMDGTLLDPRKKIDPQSLRDIQWASDQGATVVYCTGRGVPELREYFDQAPMMRYAVCNSGAVVYDRAEDRVIAQHLLPKQYVNILLDLALRHGAMPHFLTARESIVREKDITHMADFCMGVYQPMFEAVARTVPDMAAEAARQNGIVKVDMYFRAPADRQRAYAEVRDLPVAIVLQDEVALETTDLGVTKASGLRLLAEHLGIPMARTVGIGDSVNDLEMLEAVGHAVAMGNAQPQITALCQSVTADTEHNGVGRAIRRLMEAQP